MRTSSATGVVPPTRRKRLSSSTFSSRDWVSRLRSPTWSRNSVPPSACSSTPVLTSVPDSDPNNCTAMLTPGTAARLISTNGRARRALMACR